MAELEGRYPEQKEEKKTKRIMQSCEELLHKAIYLADETRSIRKGAELRIINARFLNLLMSDGANSVWVPARNQLCDWIICSSSPCVSQEQRETAQKLKTLYLPMTEAEKRMVHMAMTEGDYFGGNGHWYVCPNNHPYFIGECGGAMEQSYCADCGAPVGGGNHELLMTNRSINGL